MYCLVIFSTQNRVSGSWGDFSVIPGYMIRYKVNDHLESGLVSPIDQRLEFAYSIFRIISKIYVYVIIVAYCIRRTGLAFYELRMRRSASVFGCLCRVSENSSEPYVAASKPFEVIQCRCINIRKLACTVFCKSAVLFRSEFIVAPQTREHLVYYRFLHSSEIFARKGITKIILYKYLCEV